MDVQVFPEVVKAASAGKVKPTSLSSVAKVKVMGLRVV